MYLLYFFVLLITYIILRYIEMTTQKKKSYKLNWKMLLVFGFIISVSCFNFAYIGANIWKVIFTGICSGWLFFNTCTDINSHDIFIFPCPFLGIFGFIYQLIYSQNVSRTIFVLLASLIIHFAFTYFWGKGDGYVFSFSSIFFVYDYSLDLEHFLSDFILKQMLFIFAAIVCFVIYNICCKNMKRNGKLKKPKEFAPSIAIAATLFF